MSWAKHGREVFPAELGSSWDGATWAGLRVPGLVRVTVSRERKIDVTNGPGLEGATLRFQGRSPAEVSVEIVIWTAEHDTELQALRAKIDPQAGRKVPQPYALLHPGCLRAGVAGVVVEKAEWDLEGPVPQSRLARLSCKEWTKVKKAVVGTPVLSAPTVAAVEPPNPAPSASGKASR